MTSAQYYLQTAAVQWQDNTPYSSEFDDIYWSRDTGVAEKSHVFLDTLDLASRWQQLGSTDHFIIAELGFGFGLNFLLTVAKWREQNCKGLLHYISIENRPVTRADLAELKRLLPTTLVDDLLAVYPEPVRGQHVAWFSDNIRLTLILDDAVTALKSLGTPVDAWYLDGFTPSKNEAVWNGQVFSRLHTLSKPGACLATYSVSGNVRRGLEGNGFDISRRPGFGKKREMLYAERPGVWQPSTSRVRRAAIIGAGLAGAYVYEALQRRGITTTVYSDEPSTSSRIPQMAVYPSLAIAAEQRYLFSLAAFDYAVRDNSFFHPCGFEIEIADATELRRWQRICEKFPDSFLHSHGNTVRFPTAGWLSSAELCTRLPQRQQRIDAIQANNDSWNLLDADQNTIAETDVVVFANGAQPMPFATPSLINTIPGVCLAIRTRTRVDTVMSGAATLFPSINGVHTLSGIYDREMSEPTRQHTHTLMDHVEPDAEILRTTMGIRAATRDRLPLAGRMPRWEILKNTSTARASHSGLFVLNGLGSHGASTARLCAEYVVNLVTGEPAAVSVDMQKALALERFARRDS
jgi:tRNA 5-methylaminomethyl-2-thiouridine biosynthesis bifunctional protein